MAQFENIADWYELLFPARPVQLDFLEGALADGAPARWLDVACGAGQQLEGLADRGRDVRGFDLEPAMIARLRARRPDLETRVALGDMRESDRVFVGPRGEQTDPAGVAYCIGNSLALLGDRKDVGRALGSIRRTLAPGGASVLQIVNFDRVLENDAWSFPAIEREGPRGACRFEREYAPLADSDANAHDARLVFRTRLVTPEGVDERSRELLALRRDELGEQLEACGFERLQWSGDYTGAPWTTSSPATIVRAATARS